MNFQWYPGHMTKAKRQMQEDIKLIDLVIELVDARIPLSSRNPDIDELGKNKYRLILMNKADLADRNATEQWSAFFKKKGYYVVSLDARSKNGMKSITDIIMEACKEKMERDRKRGIKNRPVRAMVVGIPNVGKSTLISVVSAAKPKIANYHFTTLTPVLGVVQCNAESSFVMADIPGLIEGASDGVGLGHAFLRHVERCRLILHVVDVSGSEGRDPIADYETIQQELERFNADLAARPQMVAANKCDMATEEQIAAFRNYIEQEKGLPFFCISAATTQGTKELVQAIGAKLTELPPILQYEPEPLTAEELAETTEKGTFEIEVEDGVYYIDAKFLEPILRTVNLDDYSSLQYFQKVLRSSGIIDKLEEMGIQEGDTVNLYGFEFDFVS